MTKERRENGMKEETNPGGGGGGGLPDVRPPSPPSSTALGRKRRNGRRASQMRSLFTDDEKWARLVRRPETIDTTSAWLQSLEDTSVLIGEHLEVHELGLTASDLELLLPQRQLWMIDCLCRDCPGAEHCDDVRAGRRVWRLSVEERTKRLIARILAQAPTDRSELN